MPSAIPPELLGTSPFVIRQGDAAPPLDYTATDQNTRDLVSLIGASAPQFHYRGVKAAAAATVTKAATILDAQHGQLRFSFATIDTAVAGDFYGYFSVTMSTGAIRSFPAQGYLRFRVDPILG